MLTGPRWHRVSFALLIHRYPVQQVARRGLTDMSGHALVARRPAQNVGSAAGRVHHLRDAQPRDAHRGFRCRRLPLARLAARLPAPSGTNGRGTATRRRAQDAAGLRAVRTSAASWGSGRSARGGVVTEQSTGAADSLNAGSAVCAAPDGWLLGHVPAAELAGETDGRAGSRRAELGAAGAGICRPPSAHCARQTAPPTDSPWAVL